jgi:NAD(P)-dependent dehydrogenase (short-subunit alcohol dehydrogenase family)
MGLKACVTGADRGVGFELVRQLLLKGYTVYAGQYAEEGQDLIHLKEQYAEQLELVPLNVADDQSVKTAADYINQRTGSLDLLINNAAILGDTESTIMDELDFDEMQRVFNVNALGALRVSNALVPLICGGVSKLIVNISSEAGSIGACWRSGWYAYCMSKAALNMQTAIIHNQLKVIGGQVMAIHPGWVQTYMRGVKDELAALTPEGSAAHILQTVERYAVDLPDKPRFVDYEGRPMEW